MSYQESTQESDPSQIDYKSLPSYTDEELYSKIMENVNKDLDNLFPESINSFQINTNNQPFHSSPQRNINNSFNFNLFPVGSQNILRAKPQNNLTPSIILPLYKVGENPNVYHLQDDFDPDFWKYFYPQNDPFFNYAYLEPLYQSKLTERNKDSTMKVKEV